MQIHDINIPMPWGQMSGRTYGEEKNTPILCIHGRADNLETFSDLIPLLPEKFYYVSIDLPGHGRSAQADIGYFLDLPWYALSVKRVIDYFKWSKIYLLGHSFGGQIGFLISALYPELVLKLMVLDTLSVSIVNPPNIAKTLRNNYFDITLNLEKRQSVGESPIYTLEDFVQKMKNARSTEVTTDQLKKMAERNLKKVGHNQYKYSNDQRTKMLGLQTHLNFEFYEHIASALSCPTLLILGKNSIVTNLSNRNYRLVTENNKNVNVIFIDGDHDIHLARPNQVAEMLVPFLTSDIKSKL